MSDESEPSDDAHSNPLKLLGRPTKYNPIIAQKILSDISEGKTLRATCRDNSINWMSVYLWQKIYPDFSYCFLQAREASAHMLIDDATSILSDRTRDLYNDGKRLAVNTNEIGRAHRIAEHYRWLAGKINPLYRDDSPVTNINVGIAIDRPKSETRDDWLKRRANELELLNKK